MEGDRGPSSCVGHVGGICFCIDMRGKAAWRKLHLILAVFIQRLPPVKFSETCSLDDPCFYPPGDESSDSSDSSSSSSSSEDDAARIAAPPASLASFEDLWGLMKLVYKETLDWSGALPSQGVAGGSAHLLAGFAIADSSPLARDGGRYEAGDASEAWKRYSSGLGQAASDAAAGSGGGVSLRRRPYPGARPLLRFKQSFVLGPTAATAATSSATPGLGPGGSSSGGAVAAGSLDADPSR